MPIEKLKKEIMKFGAVCVILVVGLIVQVTIFGLRIDGSFFFVFLEICSRTKSTAFSGSSLGRFCPTVMSSLRDLRQEQLREVLPELLPQTDQVLQ